MKIKNDGITLIALIITIILMLILAGVVLNLTIGENGLFSTAKYATKKWNNSVERENAELDELYAYINSENLPENTKDTTAGTLVAVPDDWKTETPAYIQTTDGKEVVSSKKVSTVAAVSVGDGQTVPVPVGFWYVGGNLSTGVVISDNKKDQNKYVNIKDGKLPSGVKVENGKFVDELIGNQFVWMPCSEEEYVKANWANGSQGNIAGRSNAYWSTGTSTAELIQIKKYGGFYVARFEASLPLETQEFTATQPLIGDIYNFEGVPESKPGRTPWNYIKWNNAQKNASKMYENSKYVHSGLITGTQWDVMINKIATIEEKDLITSTDWGNYQNSTFTYTGMASRFDGSLQHVFGNLEENATKQLNDRILLKTGTSDNNRAYNLYDVSGNLWEWTEEAGHYDGGQYYNLRGGSYCNLSTKYSACYRLNSSADFSDCDAGFRVILYMR